jgi:hypothetical protein
VRRDYAGQPRAGVSLPVAPTNQGMHREERRMQKNKTNKRLRDEYEKVFESPLDWCPVFGYVPCIEEYRTCNDREVLEIIEDCIGLIHSCREGFLLDYSPSFHVRKYVCLPEIETILPRADNDDITFFRSLRNLFRNLDFLLLRTASLCNNPVLSAMNINSIHKTIKIETDFPKRPIGRVSNHYDNWSSVTARDIRLDRVFWRDSFLVQEANKFWEDSVGLDNIMLLSLYSILEAWLVLTGLFYFKSKPDKDNLLFYVKRLHYANVLNAIADHHNDIKYYAEIYNENLGLAEERWRRKEGSSLGGGNKVNGIKAAIKEIITNTLPHANHVQVFNHIKNNHTGKTRALKCGRKLIFWRNDKSGEHPEGFIIEYDTNTKIEKTNIMKSFERNFSKAKYKINNNIKRK